MEFKTIVLGILYIAVVGSVLLTGMLLGLKNVLGIILIGVGVYGLKPLVRAAGEHVEKVMEENTRDV
jgi:hypothetical protein